LANEHYVLALKQNQNNPQILEELGDYYKTQNRFQDALNCYCLINPRNGVVLNEMGICHFGLLQHDLAIDYFKQVLAIKNDLTDVYNNIGVCYVHMKQYTFAEFTFKISYSFKSDTAVLKLLGSLYFTTKQYEKSVFYWEKIDDLTIPDLYNLSFSYLAQKKYEVGFKLYENRLLNNNINYQTKEKERVEISWIPYWNGVDAFTNLLIIYEQGIGDNIQYFRFIIELSEKYKNLHISYFCKDIVSDLFLLKDYPNLKIVDHVSLHEYSHKAFIMSLPYLMKVKRIEPVPKNYIKVNEKTTEYWKNAFSSFKKRFKVGYCHTSLLRSSIDKDIQLREVEKLLSLDIDLICICKKQEMNLLELKEMEKYPNFHYFDIDQTVPFSDTIAILQNIDLLVTVDTYIVHLAGVMGIRTWLLLGYVSEWRWSNDEKFTYWYNTVELLRIESEGKEFKYILDDVKEKLSNI